eukprot:PhF_6_TR35035/c0_g1_i1/m.51051
MSLAFWYSYGYYGGNQHALTRDEDKDTTDDSCSPLHSITPERDDRVVIQASLRLCQMTYNKSQSSDFFPSHGHRGSLMSDRSKAVSFGGFSELAQRALNCVVEWDIIEGVANCFSFNETEMTLPCPRLWHSFSPLLHANDKAFIYGGAKERATGAVGLSDCWLYSQKQRTFTRCETLSSRTPCGRYLHTACSLGEHKLWIHGGRSHTYVFDDAWIFYCDTGLWLKMETTDEGPGSRYGHDCSLDADRNRIYVACGCSSDKSPVGDFWYLDLNQGAWVFVRGISPSPRWFHTLLPFYSAESKLLVVVGGRVSSERGARSAIVGDACITQVELPIESTPFFTEGTYISDTCVVPCDQRNSAIGTACYVSLSSSTCLKLDLSTTLKHFVAVWIKSNDVKYLSTVDRFFWQRKQSKR